jgi:UDP-N-acetylglucosamine acyltransferase
MSVHPTAIVAPGARLGAGVRVGPFAVIEDGAVVGDGCEIRAHAVVKSHVVLGRDNRIHEGAVIGGEPQDLSFQGGETGVVIGERNVLREGVTVHRSTKPGSATIMGSDCFLMAYVHLGHDCRLGDHVVIANNTALGGHVQVAERAFVSGNVSVHQFCRIGRLAMLGGSSKAVQDCLPFVTCDGHIARARGLNVVGLRRAGVGSEQRRTLKEGYRLLLRSGLLRDQALERMSALADPLVDEMVAFVRASKRGFAHGAHGSDES